MTRTRGGSARSRTRQDSVGIRRKSPAARRALFLSPRRRRSEGYATPLDLAGHEPPHALMLRPACQTQHPVCRPRPPTPVVAGCLVGIVGAVEHLLQELGSGVAPEGVAAILAPAAQPRVPPQVNSRLPRFLDVQNLVRLHVLEHLGRAAGPLDFDTLRTGGGAQSQDRRRQSGRCFRAVPLRCLRQLPVCRQGRGLHLQTPSAQAGVSVIRSKPPKAKQSGALPDWE